MQDNFDFKVHFIGVCGAGMSVLAKYLKSMGFYVSGSDVNKNSVYYELIKFGIDVFIGHLAKSVQDADIVVYSSSISNGNVELKEAKRLNKAVYKRAELLSLIMSTFKSSVGFSGSHGKTTSVAMASHILKKSLIGFTALIGGNDVQLKNFVFSKENNVILSEVCEFEKNISYISPKIGVVLNVDNDHLDTYKTLSALKSEFFSYLDRSKFKVINLDDELLKSYGGNGVISYAINSNATYKAENIKNIGGKYSFTCKLRGNRAIKVNLNVYGFHNIYNALANIAVFDGVFKFDADIIKSGLESFSFIERRFESLGKLCNKNIYADYSHHPTEISATLKAYDEILKGDFCVIFQPHTYSRTKLLYKEFVKALKGYNAYIYKAYPAREKYSYFGSAKRLAKGLKCKYIKNRKILKNIIYNEKYTKNFILLGAGDLYDVVKEYVSMASSG